MSAQFYSQDGQDKFLVELFKHKRDGYFLDIGAYDGIIFSNSLYFERNLSWKGICIEPNPEIFERLKSNRSSINLNCCVSDVKTEYEFLSVSGWGSMLSGIINFFDQKHLERIDNTIQEKGGHKTVVNIQALPLRDIFDAYAVKYIDYCNIDVEGGEMKVLQSIDFSKVQIQFFTIENNYDTRTVRKFLKPYGYKLIAKLGADEVYEFNSQRYLLLFKLKLKSLSVYLRMKLKKTLGR